MSWLYLIILSIAVSSDNFCVGISYGIRQIRLSSVANLIMSGASGLMVLLSMLIGNVLTHGFSLDIAQTLGAVFIIVTGIWIIVQAWWERWKENLGEKESVDLVVKPLGIIIRILNNPIKADLDQSGTINNLEALTLGIALALNAPGAGIGAAMEGLPAILTSLIITFTCFSLTALGVQIGRKYATNWLGDKVALVSGLVLIILGLWEMFT